LKTSFFSGLTKVDHFLQQYQYSELLGGIKKILNRHDFTNIKAIVDKKLESLEKNLTNFFEYRNLQIEKIVELELHKQTKLNLNVFDENFYSYKLIF
jgi:hypothetical protein